MGSITIETPGAEFPHLAIAHVADISPFFASLIEQHADLARQVLPLVDTAFDRSGLVRRYEEFLDTLDASDIASALRRLRQREMIRIIYRDLTRTADLLETTAELSHLADFCIGKALDHHYESLARRHGTPLAPDGSREQMVVLGMGKLGAFELNLSSDVDLIFFYSHPGEVTDDAGKVLTHQEFFLRLARQVIGCLEDARTIDMVFRVDMRLRPFGDSGPLVLHRAAMEKYYLEQGRDWERYAFIKARIVAGDVPAGESFLGWMKPFVFRRHLDFSTIQSLREMKGLIARQVELKAMNNDLKLGPGGIREIEFIAQAHQLIWGGRLADLQEPRLLTVLDRLAAHGLVPADEITALKSAYTFLRNSEHAIQAEHDRQTHALPDSAESKSRLARAMDFDNYPDYLACLDAHRERVAHAFTSLVAASGAENEIEIRASDREAWQTPRSEAVKAFRQQVQRLEIQDTARQSLDQLMPMLLHLVQDAEDVMLAETRMLAIVQAILRRSTYLVFLLENTDALRRAVELVTISSWIAEQIASYPILLYELTDRAISEVAISKKALEGELREIRMAADPLDLETQMDTLRQFKLAAMLKVAAMELLDRISIMQASDALTALAEVLLDTSIELAWRHLEGRHGLPCDEEGVPLRQRLAIIAYGKAGGLELAYGSDLDLVFLCPNAISGYTDGVNPVNNNVFYVRLGQRIIHVLTRFTRFGILYSADLRLRPQGNKGPLVATIGAFDRYQHNDAWTWEHQALIRARFVAGDPQVGELFEKIRRDVIEKPRVREKLQEDVLSMRERMREHLSSNPDDGSGILGRFDLKHDAGAIVDIEFMVQYAVLAWASDNKALSRWTDVMRLLDELGDTSHFSEAEVDALQRAYLVFRAAVHHGWLGLETDYERLHSYRDEVRRIWQARMLGGSLTDESKNETKSDNNG